MTKRVLFACNAHILIMLSLLYMGIAVMLFLFAWYELYVSLIASVAIVGSIVYVCKKGLRNDNDLWLVSLSDLLKFSVFIVIICLCLYGTGICGGVPTHPDYENFRNALYHNLIDAPWPVFLPDGKEFTYYVSGMLVPAMFARLTASYAIQQWILFVWCVVPIALAFALLCCYLKRVSWVLFLVGIFCVMPVERECEVEFVSKMYNYVCWLLFGEDWNATYICGRFMAIGMNLPALLAVSAPLLVVSLLLSRESCSLWLVPLIMALLACLSPIGAVGVFPIAMVRYACEWKKSKEPFLWRVSGLVCPILLVSLWLMYFGRAESETYIGFVWGNWKWESVWAYYLPAQVILCILMYHLIKFYKADIHFLTLCVLIFCCPLLYIGSRFGCGHGAYNELWFKSSPAYITLLAYYITAAWQALPQYVRVGWMMCCALAIYSLVCVLLKWEMHKPTADRWNGHLYHPGYRFLNQSTPECNEPWLPYILLRGSGSSEQLFPCMYLPKAPGCDYNRPVIRKKE